MSSPLSPLWVAVPELAELRWFVAVGGMGSASSSGNNTSTTALPSGLRPLTFILSKFLASPPEVGLGRAEQLIMKQYSPLFMNTMGCCHLVSSEQNLSVFIHLRQIPFSL